MLELQPPAAASLLQVFAVAAVSALALTPAARYLAVRLGAVAAPRKDRWHRAPVAMLGGVAVCASVLVAAARLTFTTPLLLSVLLTGCFMCVVGLVDDFVNLKPSTKVTAQIAAACFVLLMGGSLDATGSPVVNAVLTIAWVVTVTNAVNLLDNMDGLCAGVVCVAAIAFTFAQGLTSPTSLYGAAIAGACAGFLVYNFNPASIFLGDAGSLFLGSSMAVVAIAGQPAGRAGLTSVLIVPALLLLLPLFDSAFVTIARKLSARSALLGGRDHTSHRLVALGFSERTAVLVLYAVAASGAAAALGLRNRQFTEAPLLLGLVVLVIMLLGLHLSRVAVYGGGQDFALLRGKSYTPLLVDITYKRRVFEVLLDFALVTFSYYAAYVIRFDREFPAYYELLVRSLPIVIAAQLVSFFVVGVYRPLWRYFSASDLTTYVRGVVVGAVVAVLALLYLYRFDGYSRGVFIVYSLLLGVLMVGSRASFKILADVASRHAAGENGALIYGAGDAGALIVRELRNNPMYGLRAVGYIDDDVKRYKRRILGITVEGGSEAIGLLLERIQPAAVIVSSAKISETRVALVAAACAARQVRLLRLDFRLRDVEPQPITDSVDASAADNRQAGRQRSG